MNQDLIINEAVTTLTAFMNELALEKNDEIAKMITLNLFCIWSKIYKNIALFLEENDNQLLKADYKNIVINALKDEIGFIHEQS